MERRKVLVACLDGLTEGYLHAYVSHLPTLRHTIYRNLWGPCRAVLPLSAPAWAEFGIGRDPTHFGVTANRTIPGAGRGWEAPDFDELWNPFRAMSDSGISVGLYHLPIWCEPPEYLGKPLADAGGWVCRGDWMHEPGRHPEDMPEPQDTILRQRIKAGGVKFQIPPGLPREQHLRAMVEQSNEIHDGYLLKAILDFAAQSMLEIERIWEWRKTDCLVAYWYGLDCAGHYLCHDSAQMQRAYEAADDWLFRLTQLADWDTVIVCSDHGVRPNHRLLKTTEVDGLHYEFTGHGESEGNGKRSWIITCGTHADRGTFSVWDKNWLKQTPEHEAQECLRGEVRLGSIMPAVVHHYGIQPPDDVWEFQVEPLDFRYIQKEKIQELLDQGVGVARGEDGINYRNLAVERDSREKRAYTEEEEAAVTERLALMGYA